MKTSASCPNPRRWAWGHLAATLALAIGFMLLGFGARLSRFQPSSSCPATAAIDSQHSTPSSARNSPTAPAVTSRSRASRIGRARATDPQTVRDLVSDSAAGLRAWAENEPAAAAAWVEKVGSVRATRRAFGMVASTWADKDLAAATAWVEGIPNAEDRSAASLAVAYEAVRTDPREAVRLAADLGEGEDKLRLLVHAAREWTLQDNSAALEWAAAVPDDKTRETLIGAIAVELADADCDSALNLVSSLLDPELQADALAAVEQRIMPANAVPLW